MVIRTCECCDFSTQYKNVFDKHLQSKHHNHNITIINTEKKTFNCSSCNKKYTTRSGLWKHSKKCCCKPEEITSLTKLGTDNNNRDKIDQLCDHVMELKKQLSELQPSITNNNTTNNTNNTTNNINILYLNTHHGNAMSIDQFVDSIQFVKDDYHEIDKNRFYYQGAASILKKYFQQIKPEDRPLHCEVPIRNTPATFFVKNESEWKAEKLTDIHWQMKYIEDFEYKEQQMEMTRFFEKITEKLYETFKDFSTSDKRMEKRINEKMMGGCSRDKIDILDELVDSKILTPLMDKLIRTT